jgi:hypothetical protein
VILHVSLFNCVLIVRVPTELTFHFLDVGPICPRRFVLFDILAVLIVASLKNPIFENVFLILKLSLLALFLLILLPNLLNHLGLGSRKLSNL